MPKTTIAVAVPLDHRVEDVIDAAKRLASRLDAAVLPVHSRRAGDERRSYVRANGGVRETIVGWMQPIIEGGLTLLKPVIDDGPAEQVVARAVAASGASLVVAGSGRGATVRDWLLGSTAERIVRSSAVPVWLARGTYPSERTPVLAPIDLGEESRLTIAAGLRWARIFGAPLRVLHVVRHEVDPDDADTTLANLDVLEREARRTIAGMLEGVDASGVAVSVKTPHGDPPVAVVAEADEAGLLVMVRPEFAELVPASMGGNVDRIVRMARCSVLTVRDPEPARQRKIREERFEWLATLVRESEDAIRAGDAARAKRLLTSAKIIAPANAPIEEALARAIEAQGRANEAAEHRQLAAFLRKTIGA